LRRHMAAPCFAPPMPPGAGIIPQTENGCLSTARLPTPASRLPQRRAHARRRTARMSTSATSFYVTGGTLRQDAPSYVERQADKDLYDGLTRGEFCYVLTSRQMGKSSLMVHTAARLREAGTKVVVLDLTAIGQNLSSEQWYGGLLRRVGLQLDPSGDPEEELDDLWFEQEQRVG